MRKSILAFGACLLLAGCNTYQKQLDAANLAAATQCTTAFGTINAATLDPWLGDPKSKTQLTNTPTPQERDELGRYTMAVNTCDQARLGVVSRFFPWRSPAEARRYAARLNDLHSLMDGKITYGEANSRMMQEAMQAQAEIVAANNEQAARDKQQATLDSIDASTAAAAAAAQQIQKNQESEMNSPQPPPPGPMNMGPMRVPVY